MLLLSAFLILIFNKFAAVFRAAPWFFVDDPRHSSFTPLHPRDHLRIRTPLKAFRQAALKHAAIALVCLVAHTKADSFKWTPLNEHRSAELTVSNKGKPGFSVVQSTQTSITFSNIVSPSRSFTNQVFLNGSGVAAGDVDGDGWCDLYFCGLDNPNELYRNLGNWKFERVAEGAGAACADQASTGAAFADLDGDDDLDLVVNGIARGTRLFENDGKGRFKEITEAAGLAHKSGSMSLAIADVNGDRLLDIYVVNYRSSTFHDEPEKRFRVLNRNGAYELVSVDGRPVTEPELLGRFTVDPATGVMENGEADILFLNSPGMKFRRVDWRDGTFTDEAGKPITVPYDWGLSAMFRDINHDGAPDLYVCNDFHSPDRIWLNDGRGKFRSAPPDFLRQSSLFSMGVDFADLDGDGLEEFFVADMLSRTHERRQTQVLDIPPTAVPTHKLDARPQYSRNTLYWNRGNGTYAEIAQFAGVQATEWSWSPAFIDVDLDGRRDLIVSTGHERDAQNIDVAREIDQAKKKNATWRELLTMRRKFPRLPSPVFAFRNNGALAFDDVTSNWGFTSEQIAHGLALADLDNDGDPDLIANCLNSPALLFRNDTPAPRIAVRLAGKTPNTKGIGARIVVRSANLPLQSDQIFAGGRYLSSDSATRTFAAGASTQVQIEVHWPGGTITSITNATPNALLELSEEFASPKNSVPTNKPAPIFQDVSARLNHRHHDEPYTDFQRQPLLPRNFSELGPAVSWFDFDDDGWEDLLIGTGRGGKLALFQNFRGEFKLLPAGQTNAVRRDYAGLLGHAHGTNRFLLAAQTTYEDSATNLPALRQIPLTGGTENDLLTGEKSSIGALTLGDADADGDLDLFAAGRIIPGRYPEPATSFVLRNDSGKWTRDPTINKAFASLGLISAATWSDITADTGSELLLALDGGPIRVFSISSNSIKELTTDLGFDQFIGWWQSITTGDLNNDGRLDIVAGNLGRNSKYQEFMPGRYSLFHGEIPDFPGMQIIEAFRPPNSHTALPLMDRDSLAIGLPHLPQRYPTFAAFSRATIPEILDTRFNSLKEIRINTTESILFLNTGSKFHARPLPLPAQFSPAFGLAVGDVNADGHQDLFLNQNLFSVGKNTSRYDAGESLLLLGNGTGELTPLPSESSGLKIDGEGRGAAFCDFDHDGRLDLVSAQNFGNTKLYRNTSTNSGLRVSIDAGPANPHGIGAVLRAAYADGQKGPAQEIRSGEGYWSQSSRTLLVATNRPIQHLELRWPDGASQQFPVPANQHELVLTRKARN